MADNKVKFLRGTSNEYTVAEKDNDTIYFTTDDGKLYIGNKEVSGGNIAESATVTLSASNWNSNSQEVPSSVATTDNVIIVSPVPEDQDTYSKCGIKCSAQSDGSLTFTCKTLPTTAIHINVVAF